MANKVFYRPVGYFYRKNQFLEIIGVINQNRDYVKILEK